MKILIVYHSGALQNARAIYRALAERQDVELTVVIPEWVAVDKVYHPSGRLEGNRKNPPNGYRLVPVPLVDPWRYNLGFNSEALRQVIKDSQAEILHVWDEPVSHCLFRAAWLRALVSRRSRLLFYGFMNTPFKWGVLGKVLWRSTWTQVAGGVTANSEMLTLLSQEGFPRNRPVERIFWGISTEVFRPMDRTGLKRDLKLDCDYVVGYVGRLVPEKGLAWLLAAVKRLPASVHCLIIGNGPMRGEVELWSELPSLARRVHLLGPQAAKELPKYLNCMDVLAVPSLTTLDWKEQYGRVIAEAMACGVPVVGSDSGAIPEVIDSAGLVVPEGDVSALAEALEKAVFGEIRGDLVQRGLERAQRELSVQAMRQRLLAFYSRVLQA